jgi:hypothetical protein
MFRTLVLPLAVVLILMAIATWMHGELTDRWGMDRPEELNEFTQRLARLPKVIGQWESTEAQVDPQQLQAARVTGHVARAYRHRGTGDVVNFFCVCGTSRHITLHTPDLCYAAVGYESEGAPQAYPVDAGLPQPVEFATSLFYKEAATGLAQLRIFWTFSGDGQWKGPRFARTALAGNGALYKMYLVVPIAAGKSRTPEDSAAIAFARDALSELQDTLFPPEKRLPNDKP